MHEMSLSEGVLQLIQQNAKAQGFDRVTAVTLAIGELAGVDGEALRFSFEAVTRGTLADSARLDLKSVPGEAWCLPCGRTVHVARRIDPCPRCGSHQLQVTGGNDMILKSLEVQ